MMIKKTNPLSLNSQMAAKIQEQFNTGVGTGGCFIKEVGGLLEQLDMQFFKEEEGRIKIQGNDALPLIKLLWTTVQNSVQDCTGKRLEITDIELGDSPVANTAETILALVITQILNA
jgi:hypothetical protein